MSFLKWFRKDKKDREKKEKKSEIPKVDSLPLPPKETEEQKRAKIFEKHINELINKYKGYGYDEESAKKKAWQEIEKKLERQKLKGVPIICSVCKRYGANKETGGYVKMPDGKYRHQNCK